MRPARRDREPRCPPAPLRPAAGMELEGSLEQSVQTRIFKIIVIGDSNVGKTCLTVRFCGGAFPASTEATIGVDFREKAVEIEGERIKVRRLGGRWGAGRGEPGSGPRRKPLPEGCCAGYHGARSGRDQRSSGPRERETARPPLRGGEGWSRRSVDPGPNRWLPVEVAEPFRAWQAPEKPDGLRPAGRALMLEAW